MTESICTTRLSSVITGCGGKETTCSRRSISGRTRSTNGITTASPGSSVLLNRPSRSTTAARACGMIRMVRPRVRSTRNAITSSTIKPAVIKDLLVAASAPHQCAKRPIVWHRDHLSLRDQRGRPVDLHDVNPSARLEHVVLVVGARAPHLAADLHLPAVGVHLLEHDRPGPDKRG